MLKFGKPFEGFSGKFEKEAENECEILKKHHQISDFSFQRLQLE